MSDESMRQSHFRYGLVLDAERLSASGACKVDVIHVSVILAPAYAILRKSRTVIDGVEDMLLAEYLQRTEYCRAVSVRHPFLHVAKGERLRLMKYGLQDLYAYRRDANAVVLE